MPYYYPYTIILFLTGIIALAIAFSQFGKAGHAGRWFSYSNLCITCWAIGYGMELTQVTLPGMLFWLKIEYLGIAFLPACWLLFMLRFTGHPAASSRSIKALLFAEPLVVLLTIWINDLHHLYYRQIGVDSSSGPFPLLNIAPGIFYIIHTIFFYATLGWGTYLIARQRNSSSSLYKKQYNLLLLGMLAPWLTNVLYLYGLKPYHHIDLTPCAFLLTSLLYTAGLRWLKLLDIIPVAREKVIEAMQDGVVVLDNMDRVVDMNPVMQQLTGYNGSDYTGISLPLLLPRADTSRLLRDRDRPYKDAVVLQQPGNNAQVFEVVNTPLTRKGNALYGRLLVFRDITEQKHYEEKLRAMNELKDRILSILSHDMRGPLTSLVSLIELLKDEMLSAEDFKTYLPSISSDVDHTLRLMDNLLLWAKTQFRGARISPSSFDMSRLVHNAAALYQTAAASKAISIRNQVQPDTRVWADEDMTNVIVTNLLSNALKFTNRNGHITVSASPVQAGVQVCVEDNGVGMDEADLQRLFRLTPFSTRGTGNEKGTGLGLLICKEFVEKNGGTLQVQSARGQGSRFCFTLPGGSEGWTADDITS